MLQLCCEDFNNNKDVPVKIYFMLIHKNYSSLVQMHFSGQVVIIITFEDILCRKTNTMMEQRQTSFTYT